MIGAKCFAIFAACVAAVTNVDAGALPAGVCYSPWHHGSVNHDIVGKDMSHMKQYFSQVRTFHASFAGVNVIDSAAAAGIKVAVTIQMGDRNGIEGEIKAACDGANRNPSAVSAIYVGNENLKNGEFGTFWKDELVGYINRVKECTGGKVKVGTVQRINEWVFSADGPSLAAACDIIGVNIYPFFTDVPGKTPIQKLEEQWAQMTEKYGGEGKISLTETGWPRAGSTAFSNTPSKETLQSFINDFAGWAKQRVNPAFFFMMYDTTVSYTGADYEKFFGLADTNGVMQVQIPSSDGAPAPAPTAATPVVTPAPAPAPAPAPVPAPSADVPGPATVAPVTDAPTAAPAPVTTAPAAGDADDGDDDDAGADATPAPVPAPAPTPAVTKKGKKTHCT